MPDNGVHIEGLDAYTEMIHVAPFLARGCTALFPELPVDRHQVDHDVAGTQVDQSQIRASPVHGAAQGIAIERDHAFEIDDAQDDVVNVLDLDHRLGA
jgi:hypothetical protein